MPARLTLGGLTNGSRAGEPQWRQSFPPPESRRSVRARNSFTFNGGTLGRRAEGPSLVRQWLGRMTVGPGGAIHQYQWTEHRDRVEVWSRRPETESSRSALAAAVTLPLRPLRSTVAAEAGATAEAHRRSGTATLPASRSRTPVPAIPRAHRERCRGQRHVELLGGRDVNSGNASGGSDRERRRHVDVDRHQQLRRSNDRQQRHVATRTWSVSRIVGVSPTTIAIRSAA